MTRTGRRRLVVLVVGALAHLLVWLFVRPDTAGPLWYEGLALELWLLLEALVAVAVGVLAPDRPTVAVTVATGWFLQVVHFVVLGEHYDDPLAGMGVVVQAFLAAAALALALLAQRLTGRAGRPTRS